MTLDLSDTAAFETFDLNLCKPGTNVKTGWIVTLAGPQHPNTIALADTYARESIRKEAAIVAAQVNGRKYKEEEEPVEARRRKNVRRVCSRILSWSPAPTFKHISQDPIEFSVDTATDVFLRPELAGYFIQITEYLNSETAFTKPSE